MGEQIALDLGTPGDATRGDRPQRRQRIALGCGLVQRTKQRDGEGVPDDGEHRDLVAVDLGPDAVRVEAHFIDEDDGAAAGEGRERDEQTGSVHQWTRRQGGSGPFPGPDRDERIRRLGPRAAHLPERGVEVVVAPHHALGHSGGAAGVEEDQVIAIRVVRQFPAFAGDGDVVGRPELEDQRSIGQERNGGVHGGREPIFGDDDPRARVSEEVARLLDAVPEVHVDRNRTDLQRRVEGFEILDGVDQVDGDLVAGGDSRACEVRRQPRRVVFELGKGAGGRTTHDRHAVSGLARDRVPNLGEVPSSHLGHATGGCANLRESQ